MKPGEDFDPRAKGSYKFYKIPQGLAALKTVSQGAKLTWGVLANANLGGECFPGYERLAAALGVSVRKVKEYTYELRDAGFIEIEREKTGARRRKFLPFLVARCLRPQTRRWTKARYESYT